MKTTWIIVLVFIIVMLPPILHPDSYLVINNDTQAHLNYFRNMESSLYGAQYITGKIMNTLSGITNIDIEHLFMWFNFLMLFASGFTVGFMVYRLCGNKYASLIGGMLIVFGTGATMHLFYSGTIFNIISILILLPLIVIIGSYLKGYWKFSVIPIFVLVLFYHPALGSGILRTGELQEAVLNPIEAVNVYSGAVAFILLMVCIYLFFKLNVQFTKYTSLVLIVNVIIVLILGVIGFCGLNEYPSRVAINMCLFLSILTVIMLGHVYNKVNTKYKIGFIVLAIIGFAPGLIHWITNTIIRGIPASAILS